MTQIESTHTEKDPQNLERESALRVLAYAEEGIRRDAPVLLRILQKRHELFDMAESDLDPNQALEEQLYEDPFYNDAFFTKDLRVRTGSEYHKEKETYDPVLNTIDENGNPTPEKDDTPQKLAIKREFRGVILSNAQKQGYVSSYIGESDNETDRSLNILPSTLEKINKPVEASVILGAAGASNLIRTWDAIRNIQSGAVDTDTIIFAAGERTAAPHEAAVFERLGLKPGATEFEQGVNALEGLGGVQFEEGIEKIPASYGENTPDNAVKRGQIVINDKIIKVIVVEGSYDRNRSDLLSGKPADRSITSETMSAIVPFLSKESKPVVIESHDTWGKGQEVVAQEILGLEAHKEIIATWAFKSDRVKIGEDGEPDIVAPGAVIDEMAKTYFNYVRLKVAALNKLKSLDQAA